ncbi:inositol 1,4,5-trisphosphate receptor-interacting protein-like 1 [Patagioenas fasciata]|uniref:inositol 1,4,5-trisphosphate receptor-interacting protein-like 1 n=1 Tax=Patagioenas fasciata TaxID=372321 RepID=UPI0032E8BEF3
MAVLDTFLVIWQILTLNVQSVGYEPDEEMRERMEQRAEMLSREMTRLWREVEERSRELSNQEQSNQEQSGFAWASLLLHALQHWHCWALAGVLVLLFGFCWWLRKRSRGPERGADDLRRLYVRRIQRPIRNWDRESEAVKHLVEKFILVFKYVFFDPWYQVLENAIEVGSAFEGWSPREEDITYRLLVLLKPPRGHIFHLEPSHLGPVRNFCIRVDLVCTCETEQPAGEPRCFLHDHEEEQWRDEGPSILHDLCTDSYLDVQKIARCFQDMLRHSWRILPESATHCLTVLPSDRSCKFQLTQSGGKRLFVELMFGVRQGDSDIFVSSQNTEAAYTPSTMWPESYAVAEMKFLRHIASQAQPDSVHLRCLQLCARSLLDTDFSTRTLKTVVMHLLTTIPLPDWGRRDFLERLEDILLYLQSCLEEGRLNHFFIGNENVPEKIVLPQALRTAEPLNLFRHLEQDPDACESAWLEFVLLQRRLRTLALQGR